MIQIEGVAVLVFAVMVPTAVSTAVCAIPWFLITILSKIRQVDEEEVKAVTQPLGVFALTSFVATVVLYGAFLWVT